MTAEVERMLAIERALDDVRFAERMLLDPDEPASWRGPARDAFVQAAGELPGFLRSAEAALERERTRALLAVRAER
ncbi:MAG: hypothetical protein M3116_04695 [Actinomycetota bacterium]|nr:hypothetical protein [Actinomycetota bacterium]